MLIRYKGVFSENGKVGRISTGKCHIRLTNETPITVRPYRFSTTDQQRIQEKIEQLQGEGLIEKSISPFAFPVVLVDKKDDGKKSRLCVDYRKLNEVTITEHYPMPLISDIEDKLLHAKYFSTLDIAS